MLNLNDLIRWTSVTDQRLYRTGKGSGHVQFLQWSSYSLLLYSFLHLLFYISVSRMLWLPTYPM